MVFPAMLPAVVMQLELAHLVLGLASSSSPAKVLVLPVFHLADTILSFCLTQTWTFLLLVLRILVIRLKEKAQLSAKAINLQVLARAKVLSLLVLQIM